MALVKPEVGGGVRTVDPVVVLSDWDNVTFSPHVNTEHSTELLKLCSWERYGGQGMSS
jgi:hypothetical protein